MARSLRQLRPTLLFSLRGRKRFHNSGAARCSQVSSLVKHAGLNFWGEFYLKGETWDVSLETMDRGGGQNLHNFLLFFGEWNFQWCQANWLRTRFQLDSDVSSLHWSPYKLFTEQSVVHTLNYVSDHICVRGGSEYSRFNKSEHWFSTGGGKGGTKGPLRVTHAAADLHRWRWRGAPGKGGFLRQKKEHLLKMEK